MHAETAYLFRHALLRDAAYQLQLPGDRARLHALALELIESVLGGRAPEPAPLESDGVRVSLRHPTDDSAAELAEHARLAGEAESGQRDYLIAVRRLYLRRAAEHAERGFQSKVATRAWEQLADLVPEIERGEVLRRWAAALWADGRREGVEGILQKAASLHRKWGNRTGDGVATENLANLYHETGRQEEAEAAHERAIAIHRETGNRWCEGVALANIANLQLDKGRAQVAEQLLEQALAIHREVGNRRSEGISLNNLANLYFDASRFEAAEGAFLQAISIHREVRNRRSEGAALANLGMLYQEAGRTSSAETAFLSALNCMNESGNVQNKGFTLGCLANLFCSTGRLEAARRSFESALAIHRDCGNLRHEAIHLRDYALCLLALDHVPEARRCWSHGTGLLTGRRNGPEVGRQSDRMRQACIAAGVPPLEPDLS